MTRFPDPSTDVDALDDADDVWPQSIDDEVDTVPAAGAENSAAARDAARLDGAAGAGLAEAHRAPFAPAPLIASMPMNLAGERLDKALAQLFPAYSRSRLATWLEAGRVTVDGQLPRLRDPARPGAQVVIEPQAAPETLAFRAEAVLLPIVFENDAAVVIDKPAGLVVHPAAGNWSGTLLNGVLYRYGDAAGALPRAGIVHRLDKYTSGLMVVARTLAAQTDLVRQLQARTVKRRYAALVWGQPPAQGTIDAPIGRDPRDRLRMAVVTDGPSKPARTHFRTLARGLLDGRAMALLECELDTGRTHQIRVHCRHIGHPLIGDKLYGGASAPAAAGMTAFERQALHAWRLGYLDPVSGQLVSNQAPLPVDMAALAQRCGVADAWVAWQAEA
ncbi:MAG: RluA family pseudouridine synthase [Janthinobacterium lividum]